MKVGFIGLGNMGQGMADNLLSKDTDLTVFTRTRSKIDVMVSKGSKGAKSIEDIANNCDLILTCLPDVQTSKDIFLGDKGLVNYVNSNHIVVDHSTVDINTSKECYTAFKNKIGLNIELKPNKGKELDNINAIINLIKKKKQIYKYFFSSFDYFSLELIKKKFT